jgi:hypothetical protein
MKKNVNEQMLKTYIRYAIDEAVEAKPDGKRGIFGRYMFADQRADVPEPKEPNTPEENDLVDAFQKHFHGRPEKLQGWVDKLLSLRDEYPSFLRPPARAKRAFRTLTVPENIMATIIGKKPTDEQHDGEVHIVQGGTMPGNFKGKTFFSWTLVPDIFYGLKKDWGSLFYTDWIKRSVGQRGYVVFAAADVSSNDFLLNPDKMKKTGLAGEFTYQVEVLSVGEVKLAEVAFFYFDEDTTPEHEAQLIRKAVNMIR